MGNRKKLPIVIQGLTDYYKEIVDYYKDYECVWATWNTEPEDRLDYISSQDNFTLALCDVPKIKYSEHYGLYTWVATLNGFKVLKERGHEFGIKIRSDFLLDIPTIIPLTKFDHFNCLGWDTGSVGYLCDYYFSSQVDLMCNVMEECIKIDSESHAENILTYALLQKLNWRKINYTLTDETKFKWIKKDIDEQHYMNHVRADTWYNRTNRKQISRFIDYSFQKDNFPDNYQLTYKTGPKQ